MRDRAPTSAWVLIVSALLPLAALLVGLQLAFGRSALWSVLLAAGSLTVASLIPVPTRSGLRLTPALSVVTALPFLALPGESDTLFGRPESIAVVLFGVAASWLIRVAGPEGRRRLLADSVRRIAASLVYLLIAHWMLGIAVGDMEWLVSWWEFLVVVGAGLAAWFVDVVIGATVRIGSPSAERKYMGLIELADSDVYVALAAAGALFGMTFQLVGWWAFVVAGLPYAFAHSAFRRYATTRHTYAQTMRALARIPEAAGHVPEGHADRTADLAGAIARRVAARPRQVELVERSAYLHDIGRISLNDPGVSRLGFTDDDLAQWGAEIVDEAGLVDVATAIRDQYQPYRHPGQEREIGLSLASRIVKVASAYDEAVTEISMSPLEAMERLHQGSVYDYDPDIVAALRSVLEERDAFTPRA